MMKKLMGMLIALMMLALSICGIASAEGETFTVENGGLTLHVPVEYKDLLIIETPENSQDGILFSVSEKASLDEAKACGDDYDGYGLVFVIRQVTEEELKAMRCGEMFGERAFAKNDAGVCYLYNVPTDYRFFRASYEGTEAEEEVYRQMQAWGNSVPAAMTAEAGLTPLTYTNTALDQQLCDILYGGYKEYQLSTTEYLEQSPEKVDPAPWLEKLVEGAVTEYIEDGQVPDGEYVVLLLPKYDERFDFFLAEGGENIVRHAWFNESYEELFKMTFTDETLKASEIMQEWYNALVEANGTNK